MTSRLNAASKGENPTYTFGHHASVLRSHESRTAANSAAYLLPFLESDATILDVGCGPGTITCDFGARCPLGTTIGIDSSDSVITAATHIAISRNLHNVQFMTENVYKLPFSAGTFDVVHAHATLSHLSDPIGALKEMRRVCKVGGIVAVRDGDWASVAIYPDVPNWKELIIHTLALKGADVRTARRMVEFAMEAGFKREDIKTSSGTLSYTEREERAWWGASQAERFRESEIRGDVLTNKLATEEDLEAMAQAWEAWAKDDRGFWAMISTELICRKEV